MIFFVYLNQRYQQQYANNYGQGLNVDDPHQFIGSSPRLAPHGAPTNPKWQTKFSSGTIPSPSILSFPSFPLGLTTGIKPDQLPSTPIPPVRKSPFQSIDLFHFLLV